MQSLSIKKEVYHEIIDKVGSAPIESGGIIAVRDEAVCDFFFMEGDSGAEFVINAAVFNSVISDWERCGKKFLGIIHSHPNGLSLLSSGDIEYARRVLAFNPAMRCIVMGIVTKSERLNAALRLYAVCEQSCENLQFEVV